MRFAQHPSKYRFWVGGGDKKTIAAKNGMSCLRFMLVELIAGSRTVVMDQGGCRCSAKVETGYPPEVGAAVAGSGETQASKYLI